MGITGLITAVVAINKTQILWEGYELSIKQERKEV
jgi:hypothetical protein